MVSSLRNTEAEHTATLTPSEEDWKRGAGQGRGGNISPLCFLFCSLVFLGGTLRGFGGSIENHSGRI